MLQQVTRAAALGATSSRRVLLHSIPAGATAAAAAAALGAAGAGALAPARPGEPHYEHHPNPQQQQQQEVVQLGHRMSTGSTDDDLPVPKLPTEVVAAAFAAAAAPTPPSSKGPVSKLQQPASRLDSDVHGKDSSMADEAPASPSSCWAQQLGGHAVIDTTPPSLAAGRSVEQESASKSVSSKPPAHAAELGGDAVDDATDRLSRQPDSAVVAFTEYQVGSGTVNQDDASAVPAEVAVASSEMSRNTQLHHQGPQQLLV